MNLCLYVAISRVTMRILVSSLTSILDLVKDALGQLAVGVNTDTILPHPEPFSAWTFEHTSLLFPQYALYCSQTNNS